MAIDNLNYYSSWLPAWQQTDKYSSQPWCLKSKNLDIFSSSKSVKATAWSEPTTTDADIVKQDWKLILKTDWKVYERENGVDTLVVDPSVNFPVYKVSYNWKRGTYENAQWGTVKDLVVKYERDDWRSFVVFTDRASYTYSKVPYIASKKLEPSNNLTYDEDSPYTNWYRFTKNTTSGSTSTILINMPWVHMARVPITIYAEQYSDSGTDITLKSIRLSKQEYRYDPRIEQMTPELDSWVDLPLPEGDIKSWHVEIEIPASPAAYDRQIELTFKYTQKSWSSSYPWAGDLYIAMNSPDEAYRMSGHPDWDYNDYYSYLAIDEDRHIVNIWEYYWLPALSYQTLYNWSGSWTEIRNRELKVRYDFVQYMWWESDTAMDIVWMVVWNEQIYMVWNLDWDWYIIPCDLTWWRWTPFIAYWCTFKGATNIDYLLYLVWEDRGVSQLWVYNWQELVPVIWWKEEKDSGNLIKNEEQYRFDWRIVNWRKNLILTTTDNRIFQYGQTYGGKWWAFSHELPWAIKELKSDWNDLVVEFLDPTPRPIDQSSWADMVALRSNVALYSESGEELWTISIPRNANTASDVISLYWEEYWFTWLSLTLNWDKLNDGYKFNEDIEQVYIVSDYLWVDKTTTYQDDTPIKNYNTEWMAEYPIVLWNHLLEKEESDLFVSYILPSADCSLEFWGMANHYHFRTFTSEDDYTFDWELSYKMKWATWNYELKFIERNGNQYTFRLVGDLPVQTTNDMEITDSEWVELINYSDFNHFRKIWEITTTEYKEWEFRFHNLNNKLELPKSHSLQIMVKGKGTQNYTPELFALDLVANQRERW